MSDGGFIVEFHTGKTSRWMTVWADDVNAATRKANAIARKNGWQMLRLQSRFQ